MSMTLKNNAQIQYVKTLRNFAISILFIVSRKSTECDFYVLFMSIFIFIKLFLCL